MFYYYVYVFISVIVTTLHVMHWYLGLSYLQTACMSISEYLYKNYNLCSSRYKGIIYLWDK